MAEDVEVMSVQDAVEEDADDGAGRTPPTHVMSTSSDILSSNAVTQSSSHSATNGDAQRGDMVSSVSDVYNSIASADQAEPCDCSSSSGQMSTVSPQRRASNTVTQSRCSQSECDTIVRYGQVNQSESCCPSDTESEIVVDDSPLTVDNTNDTVGSSNDNGTDLRIEIVAQDGDNGSIGYIRPLGRSRSVTPSPSYIRLATPSTPGTPRLRSGSVSGTNYAPLSPHPSTRGTPAERQRAGSMGEIEMKERAQGRVKIIDGLDILQLPRPRNPGGILPLNGHDNMDSSNEALNLIIDGKPNGLPTPRSFQNQTFCPLDSVSTSLPSKQSNTSYMISNIIKTTPNRHKPSTLSSFNSSTGPRQGCAINESVERPKPSSIVDSEGVAKKIARLNSGGFLCTSTTESLWSRNQSNDLSSGSHLSSIRVISDKTPPERPKPPRRTVLSPADNGNIDLTGDRFVSSSVRRRLSPANTLHREQVTSVNGSGDRYDMRSDSEVCPLPHHYKCRLCNYSASSFNMLQIHTSKHGGSNKTFRCSLCDYTTVEKTNFRRHRRLHHKSSPVNMLKCVKCSFSTSLSRKLRDHYQQAHPDLPASTLLPGLTSGGGLSPPSFIGSHCIPSETSGSFPAQYYDNSALMNRTDRLGYPYSITGRHPSLNLPFDQYSVPYNGFRDRQGENIASNYLRSIVTSIMNSEGSSRQAAPTSTVTSSNYYLPGADNSTIQDIHTCSGQGTCPHTCNLPHSGIKIKVEADTDNASDVSSCNLATPDISRDLNDHIPGVSTDNASSRSMLAAPSHMAGMTNGNSIRRHRSEDAISSNSHANDLPTDLSSPRKHRAISNTHPVSSHTCRINLDNHEMENGSDTHNNSINNTNISSVSDTVVKSDSTARGIQCVLPLIKTEIDLDGDYYDLCHRPRFTGVDRAVQCNMNNTAASNRSQNLPNSRLNYRSQSASDTSEHSEQHSFCAESRCEHCGISFEDEVIFSIHIGCHSHTDPFKCNVCGKQCGNKYGFYSHIMRGHHF